ncbi:nuclease-related domain-containing protein [Mangrovibacillus cuniculi]|uniref:NERD domain-containing protein n=1 Tax=Mangrovibacillus cuniculi TaxID=2593652 RepID=A0A7S8HGR2_9BACI|nr:nuclease-related domain-containing protein [Mangrovibacillus cuniculi]QPC48259.1 NERD domain-containing protein [Mangrovibacillus cuniculi]
MILKQRGIPRNLQFLSSLHARRELTEEEERAFRSQQKGYEGEKQFDCWLKPVVKNAVVLNDLLLEQSNSVFQIDTLFMQRSTIHLFEVKNVENEYYIEGDTWFSGSHQEVNNPLNQLYKTTSHFKRLLQHHRISYHVEPHLIFINPTFTLYGAPKQSPITMYAQLPKLLEQLSVPAQVTNQELEFGNKLIDIHEKTKTIIPAPEYTYDGLEKGLVCPKCCKLYPKSLGKYVTCGTCGIIEEKSVAIERAIEEFMFLFPEEKVTNRVMREWCGINSKRVIRNVLDKKLTLQPLNKYAYYS